jgi:hypothetical protein
VKIKKMKKGKGKGKKKKEKKEGGSNILTHRLLLHICGNAQGIEEYKGIPVWI